MRATKHFLFVLGLVGVLGAFLPMFEIRQREIVIQLTARELSFGLSRTHKALAYDLPSAAERRLPADVRYARDDARLVAKAAKGAMALYVPGALLLLIALLAQYRGRLGRGLASVAVVCGAASTAAWFALGYGLDYGLAEAAIRRSTVSLELGAHLLLVSGIGGCIAGIVGVIRPELPRSRKPPPAPPITAPAA